MPDPGIEVIGDGFPLEHPPLASFELLHRVRIQARARIERAVLLVPDHALVPRLGIHLGARIHSVIDAYRIAFISVFDDLIHYFSIFVVYALKYLNLLLLLAMPAALWMLTVY